jgi:hypothetical protein
VLNLHFSCRWYSSPAAWRLIVLRFLPWLLGLSLAWEIAQLPLYTLWREAPATWIAFSVAHCTAGDALIGVSALAAALVLTRAEEPSRWRWGRIAILTAVLAATYTVFSEWMNTAVLRSWTYSELMPVLRVAGTEIGLAPLAQWLLLPPLALRLARPRD